MPELPDRYFWVVMRRHGDLRWSHGASRQSPKLYLSEASAKQQLGLGGVVVRVKLMACPESADDWLPY